MTDIPIIYKDQDMLVLNKPAGISVHGDGRSTDDVITDWLIKNFPEVAGVGEPPFIQHNVEVHRPGVVHRLDKETSGILVVARTAEAHAFLKEQFQNRGVVKEYRALIHGVMRDDWRVIDLPIGKSASNFRIRTTHNPRGVIRDAVTEIMVRERFRNTTYITAFPKTGRTHQIRVHCAAIQHPVLCDSLYTPTRVCMPEMGRLALHAFTLEITIPSGKRTKFEAPLPADFEAALATLRIT